MPTIDLYMLLVLVYGIGEAICVSVGFVLLMESHISGNRNFVILLLFAITSVRSLLNAGIFILFQNYFYF